MSNRKIVEGIIADWRRREAGARFSATRNPDPTDRTQTDEADRYAARATALERLLAVADAAAKIVAPLPVGIGPRGPEDEVGMKRAMDAAGRVWEELERAVRAWEAM